MAASRDTQEENQGGSAGPLRRQGNACRTAAQETKHAQLDNRILSLMARDTGQRLTTLPDDWRRGWKLQQKRTWVTQAIKECSRWYSADMIQQPITDLFQRIHENHNQPERTENETQEEQD
jgi:hypothetical protein